MSELKNRITGSISSFRLWLAADNRHAALLIFLVLFATVGTVALYNSRAASPAVAIEAENGNLSGRAFKIDDGDASKGSGVQFSFNNISFLQTGTPSGLNFPNGIRLGIATGYPYVKDNIYPNKFSLSYSKYVDKVASLNVAWMRTDAIINGTQPITILDETLLVAKSKGMKVLAVFTYGDINKPDELNYRLAAYIDHWKSLKLDDAVGGYEMWNEPNNTGDSRFPFQDPAAMRTWLKKAYPIIKQRTPNTPIALGGFSPGGGNDPCCNGNLSNPADYLNRLYTLNGGNSKGMFDVVAMHPYATAASNYPEANNHPKSGMRVTHYLRKVMNQYGDQAKQIWATEAGTMSCGNNGYGGSVAYTEAQRSVRLINDLNDWFYGVHDDSGQRIGYSKTGDWNTGLFMIFKLYKAGTGGTDDDHGLIYTGVVNCDGKGANYEPPIVDTIRYYANTPVNTAPTTPAR